MAAFRATATRRWSRSIALEEAEEIDLVKALIRRHADYTGSDIPRRVLKRWDEMRPKFVKVYPERLPPRGGDAEAI